MIARVTETKTKTTQVERNTNPSGLRFASEISARVREKRDGDGRNMGDCRSERDVTERTRYGRAWTGGFAQEREAVETYECKRRRGGEKKVVRVLVL